MNVLFDEGFRDKKTSVNLTGVTFQEALDRHNGNKPKAAEELGISLKTLYNKLNQASALEKTA